MAALSMLVQIVGLCVAVYLAFSRSFVQGLTLAVVIMVAHFVCSKLSNFLMYIHQKSLTEEELADLAHRAQQAQFLGIGANDAAPTAWKMIANGCAVLYLCFSAAVIWFFFQG
jgi:hypothetical protein